MKLVAGFATACVAMVLMLSGKPEFTNACRPPRGIANPVIAMEMVRNVEEVDAILGSAPSPDREAMRIKQYLDFGFIACYTGLYLALARMFGTKIAIFAAAAGVVAAICDVVENIGILRVVNAPLDQTTQAMVDFIRTAATTKWTLTWIVMAIFAALLLRHPRVLPRLIAAVFAVSAGLGFYGLYDNAFLVGAGLPMLAGLIGLGCLFFVRAR